MKQKATLIVILLAFITLGLGNAKTNLNGTWVRKVAPDSETNKQDMVIELKGHDIHIVYHIDDPAGKRTLDLKGKTDGQKYQQTVLGAPATLITKWEGEDFVLDIIREPGGGYIHSHRQCKFSANGKTFKTEATYFFKDGTVRIKQDETWEKQ
ncbi:MAG: hypothetical protein IPM66_06125 [Acidobacteriota bacterium]|nr:MAG: hypothetical protein IPM66_06125 [Acidobacteriota bacterium]